MQDGRLRLQLRGERRPGARGPLAARALKARGHQHAECTPGRCQRESNARVTACFRKIACLAITEGSNCVVVSNSVAPGGCFPPRLHFEELRSGTDRAAGSCSWIVDAPSGGSGDLRCGRALSGRHGCQARCAVSARDNRAQGPHATGSRWLVAAGRRAVELEPARGARAPAAWMIAVPSARECAVRA